MGRSAHSRAPASIDCFGRAPPFDQGWDMTESTYRTGASQPTSHASPLFGSDQGPATGREAIDLRPLDLRPSPLFSAPSPARVADPAPDAPRRSGQPRRLALLAEFGVSQHRPDVATDRP